ncbi:class I SAM-dependent methyltransferase [Butyrivibrio sp. AE3006]|uniref:class I SAM-dependent methyltransferase n=1 Tax=Butyrivibrio sp. AE3006 TaxID=1280673 RepID=UPI00040CDEE2|nr:class I SAM-dependent methyltransferase [Butyrivibrio sp. AE3006]
MQETTEKVQTDDYSEQHKKAWEFDAYNFWVRTAGTPAERAAKDKADPRKMLKQHAGYFDSFEGVKVANICGSCGKKAIPLALLGSEVTIFDISEDNKKYAMETADAAGVSINCEVCDILKIDMEKYAGYFDVVFMEGGILHYFHDIGEFMNIMYCLLKPYGKLICSDFHPFTKIADILKFGQPTPGYFYSEVFEGEMAHARFYDEEIRRQIPKCKYRKYTISEIINGIIDAGFTLVCFDEHPAWEDDKLPGEFTAIARKV